LDTCSKSIDINSNVANPVALVCFTDVEFVARLKAHADMLLSAVHPVGHFLHLACVAEVLTTISLSLSYLLFFCVHLYLCMSNYSIGNSIHERKRHLK